ncbi:hypothetical protein GGX14DRAFT_352634, partial [Mycena pura]
HKHAAEYRDTSEDHEPLPPHSAYYHMKRTNQHQCIVFRFVHAIETVLELTSVSNPGKQGSKLELAAQGPASDFVLESFGNARTPMHFRKYTELSDGFRASSNTTSSAIVRSPNGELNFHILYYLVGTPASSR